MEKEFGEDKSGVKASRAAEASSAMRERSGEVNSSDPLVAFLYVLVRDHIQPGMIEDIMRNNVIPSTGTVSEYSNGWLALYAQDIANRLRFPQCGDCEARLEEGTVKNEATQNRPE